MVAVMAIIAGRKSGRRLIKLTTCRGVDRNGTTRSNDASFFFLLDAARCYTRALSSPTKLRLCVFFLLFIFVFMFMFCLFEGENKYFGTGQLDSDISARGRCCMRLFQYRVFTLALFIGMGKLARLFSSPFAELKDTSAVVGIQRSTLSSYPTNGVIFFSILGSLSISCGLLRKDM